MLPAFADDGANCNSMTGECEAASSRTTKVTNIRPTRPTADEKSRAGQAPPISAVTSSADRKHQAATAESTALEIQRRVVAYQRAVLTYNRCLDAREVRASAPNCSQPAPPVTDAPWLTVGRQDAGAPPVPVITPEQAAYMALAQLQLPTVAPGIGPDPDKNEWKMAAVGFPLWLWADGDTHVGPVTRNVANLSVSLDARIAKMVFKMGDGQRVTCAGAGKPYAYWVEPGTKSPDCGYIYEKPSLPGGKYTVSAVAYWEVTWQVNGATGVITVPRPSSVQLPVGELQAVVTG
jgi:hypothetical protein